ncbi:unnamed protein product, partial [Amoebophrya sp. A25]
GPRPLSLSAPASGSPATSSPAPEPSARPASSAEAAPLGRGPVEKRLAPPLLPPSRLEQSSPATRKPSVDVKTLYGRPWQIAHILAYEDHSGSGFLAEVDGVGIGLMTNQHVVPSREYAIWDIERVTFQVPSKQSYREGDGNGRSNSFIDVSLDPSLFFYTPESGTVNVPENVWTPDGPNSSGFGDREKVEKLHTWLVDHINARVGTRELGDDWSFVGLREEDIRRLREEAGITPLTLDADSASAVFRQGGFFDTSVSVALSRRDLSGDPRSGKVLRVLGSCGAAYDQRKRRRGCCGASV